MTPTNPTDPICVCGWDNPRSPKCPDCGGLTTWPCNGTSACRAPRHATGCAALTCPHCQSADAYHGVVTEPDESPRWACDECGQVDDDADPDLSRLLEEARHARPSAVPVPAETDGEVEALRAEVKHWKDHAEEAGRGFTQVCRDAARLAARNVELSRRPAETDGLAESAAIAEALDVAATLLRQVAEYWAGRPLMHHGAHIYEDFLDVTKAIEGDRDHHRGLLDVAAPEGGA